MLPSGAKVRLAYDYTDRRKGKYPLIELLAVVNGLKRHASLFLRNIFGA